MAITSEQLRAQMEQPGYQPPQALGLNMPSTPGYVWGPGGHAVQGYSTSFNGQLTSGTPGMPTQQQVEAGAAPSLGIAPVAQPAGATMPAQMAFARPMMDPVKNAVAQPMMPRKVMQPGQAPAPAAGMAAPIPGPAPAAPAAPAMPQTGGGFAGALDRMRASVTAPQQNPWAKIAGLAAGPGGTAPATTGGFGRTLGTAAAGVAQPATTAAPPMQTGGLTPSRPMTPTGVAPVAGAPTAPGFAPTTAIDPTNPSLRGRQLDFNIAAPAQVRPDQVKQQALDTFNAQILGMDAALEERVRDLSRSTAAMGRTGSGLHDRAFRGIEAQERGAREGLLGQLTMQGALADQGANLQAGLAHQPLAMQHGLLGMAHQLGERGYQDDLANKALADQAMKLGFLNQGGFGQDPTAALLGAGGTMMQGANQYGANAATLNDQVGGGVDLLSQIFFPQGGNPAAVGTPPIVAPPRQLPQTTLGIPS